MVCVLEDDNDRALCIIRDYSGLSPDSKIELQVSGKMPVQDFVREIANHFNYEPESFELILRSGRPDEVILTDNCGETLEDRGISIGSTSRNAFVLCGKNASPPQLKGSLPTATDEDMNSDSPRLKACLTANDEDHSQGAKKLLTGPPSPPPPLPQLNTQCSPDITYTSALIKHDTGYVGLVNQAMTCYLNSLLQALFMTPEFRNALYIWKFDPLSQSTEKSIPFQLQKLFLNLQTSCKTAVETTELTRSFGWDSSEAWQQHDIQELCRVMFDALEQVLKHTAQSDLIDRLYQGKMIDYVKCLECGREKSREDTFLDIPLPVRPFGSSVAYSSVEEAMRAFVQPETLEGNNQYHCENCAKKCDAHKGLKFSKFPYLLTLHLKRFDFDYNTMHRIKLNDKVVFPEILDLNSFILPEKDEGSEGIPEELPADNSTTDSGSAMDDESCQGSSDAAQDDDEGIDVSGGGGNNHHENEKNKRHALQKGPYTYELFSIMIHSGSASGGHYYAYIKDFSNGEWFCFNDQTVSRITNDDIAKTYGGGHLRGYYSGAYSSSTNAYMLMYRQIDKERNCEAFNVDQFPIHIKELHQKLQEGEETDRKIREKQNDFYKIKLYCNYPKPNSVSNYKMYCPFDTPLKQATELAYKKLKLEGVALEDCRLVNYNHMQETIEVSFEGRDDDPISEVFSSLKAMYKNDFLLDVKPKNGQFQVYHPGSIVAKVYLIDMEKEDFAVEPTIVYGNLSQTVMALKENIGTQLNIEPASLKIVLEKYPRDLQLVEDNNMTLRQAGFTSSSKICVCSGPCDPDPEKPFITSKLYKLIERFDNVITLHFSLPDTEPETLSRLSIPSYSMAQAAANAVKQQMVDVALDKMNNSVEVSAASGSRGLMLPLLLSGGDEEGCEAVVSGQSDQSTSEDSSLTDSDRTLIGDVPDECSNDAYYQSASPAEESASAVASCTKLAGEECAEDWEDEEPAQQSRQIYFKAIPYTENGQKMLKVLVDKRTIVGVLMTSLEPHVGVPQEYFKMYKTYSSGHQELECSRLRESLNNYKNNEKLSIKLGRALRSGEFNIKVYQFTPDNTQPFKFLFDWIISKGGAVGDAKKEILDEMNRKFSLKFPFDSCRLRKKNWKSPAKVLLDCLKWVDDIPVFANYEIALQELSGQEIVNKQTQMLLFIKRWYPSSLKFSPFEEIVMDGFTVTELKQKLSDKSGIPVENIEFAKGTGSFPCDVSVLSIQTDLEWNHKAESLEGFPFQCTEDGHVIYYRDNTEEVKSLTIEEHYELNSKEAVRLNSHTSTTSTYSPRRERGLKIYLDPTPPRPKVTVESDID